MLTCGVMTNYQKLLLQEEKDRDEKLKTIYAESYSFDAYKERDESAVLYSEMINVLNAIEEHVLYSEAKLFGEGFIDNVKSVFKKIFDMIIKIFEKISDGIKYIINKIFKRSSSAGGGGGVSASGTFTALSSDKKEKLQKIQYKLKDSLRRAQNLLSKEHADELLGLLSIIEKKQEMTNDDIEAYYKILDSNNKVQKIVFSFIASSIKMSDVPHIEKVVSGVITNEEISSIVCVKKEKSFITNLKKVDADIKLFDNMCAADKFDKPINFEFNKETDTYSHTLSTFCGLIKKVQFTDVDTAKKSFDKELFMLNDNDYSNIEQGLLKSASDFDGSIAKMKKVMGDLINSNRGAADKSIFQKEIDNLKIIMPSFMNYKLVLDIEKLMTPNMREKFKETYLIYSILTILAIWNIPESKK